MALTNQEQLVLELRSIAALLQEAVGRLDACGQDLAAIHVQAALDVLRDKGADDDWSMLRN